MWELFLCVYVMCVHLFMYLFMHFFSYDNSHLKIAALCLTQLKMFNILHFVAIARDRVWRDPPGTEAYRVAQPQPQPGVCMRVLCAFSQQ